MTPVWHMLETEEVLDILSSSNNGLTQSEAAARLQEYGLNEIKIEAKGSTLRIFLRQFTNILTVILLVAVAVSAVVGETVDALLILAIVLTSALLGFAQEYRAEKALEALQQMLSPTAVVVRDGRPTSIPSSDVVPGDILLLKEGDRLPADGRVLESINMKINEAAITGESIPVQKNTSVLPEATSLGDRRNMVLSGTEIIYGKGTSIVVSTGLKTEFGKIASQVATVIKESTPLEKRTKEIGFWLGTISLSVCIIVIAISLLRRFIITGVIEVEFAIQILLFGIALAVAAVPEALPGVVTGSLAIGMHRMAKENALIRRMAAVETLGCTSVICSDKTGTITRGEMTVRELYFNGVFLGVKGEGYDPVGEIFPSASYQSLLQQERFRLLMEACVLCNDAHLDQIDGRWKVLGDPTEGALIVLAKKVGIDVRLLRSQYPRTGEIPFSSDRKRMTTIHSNASGTALVFIKGGAEYVLEKCSHVAEDWGRERMTNAIRDDILQKTSDMAARALRVLAIGYRENGHLDATDEDTTESNITFLGLVGMIDPPRKDAIDAIRICKSVGIRPIMITGDHKLTAVAIAEEVGIRQPDDLVMTDMDLQEISESDYLSIVDKVTVYARVSPASKLKIVQAWKRRNEVVAMTGDGVNDAPALKQADIGIAMGITGTEVTKEAADLVLADDNFATIEKAIELGRWIYDNIQKYLAYLLRANLIEIIVLSLIVLIGYPLPLLPAQILYINLVTDGLPAIALGLSPPDSDIMKRPPRNPNDSIFSKDVKKFYLITVLVQVPIFLFIFMSMVPLGAAHDDPSMIAARTLLFYLFVFSELTLALTCRSLKHTILESPPHKLLLGSVGFSTILTIIIFGFVPGAAEAFGIAPLSIMGIEIILAICILTLIAIEGFKIITRRANNNANQLNRKMTMDL